MIEDETEIQARDAATKARALELADDLADGLSGGTFDAIYPTSP